MHPSRRRSGLPVPPLARVLAPLAAIVLASGCAAVPAERTGGGPDAPSGVPATTLEDARRIGLAAPGERVALSSGTLPGLREVIVGESYPAASGRRCRRLIAPDGTRLSRIVCGTGERWRVVRSLESAAVAAPVARVVVPALAGARPEIVPIEAVIDRARLEGAFDAPAAGAGPHDTVEHALRDGETLWSFAERSTGDGLHWREIAALNGIVDPERLESGTRLAVPSALASSVREAPAPAGE